MNSAGSLVNILRTVEGVLSGFVAFTTPTVGRTSTLPGVTYNALSLMLKVLFFADGGVSLGRGVISNYLVNFVVVDYVVERLSCV